jgi:hypothetical protein
MKEVVLKYSFTTNKTIKHQSSSPIDYLQDISNIFTNEKTFDIFGGMGPIRKELPTPKRPLFLFESTVTNNEEYYVENYGNPLCTVEQDTITVVIEEEGDKISLKLFFGYRRRMRGVKYFKVVKNVDYITVNRKTGDVYVGYLHGYQNKRKFSKKLRRNYFADGILSVFKNKLRNCMNINNFMVDDVNTVLNTVIGAFTNKIDGNIYKDLDEDERLFLFYLKKRGVKFPNNFSVYRTHLIGPVIRKKLNKNGGKLVDAFMEVNNLKGKILKSALHECNRINMDVYKYAVNVFGQDRLNQDEGVIVKLLSSKNHVNNGQYKDRIKELMTPSELDRYYKMFKSTYATEESYDIYTLSDHIRMYVQLKNYGENVKWMSDGSDRNFYQNEHLDWTDTIQHYSTGTFTRIYPKILDEMLSNEIDGYNPVLLKTSEQYNEESSFQSNCVKGYISKVGSMIISLRKDGQRATIEYKIGLINEQTHIGRVQTLGKHNKALSDDWNDVLLKLDNIMLSYGKHKEFRLPDIIKETKNGMKIHSGSKWDGPFLKWENPVINENSYFW